MGVMHVVRTLAAHAAAVRIDALDPQQERLDRLAELITLMPGAAGVQFLQTWSNDGDYDYISMMVPLPSLVEEALVRLNTGGILNAFAGFALGTMADIDLDLVAQRGLSLIGSSGSSIVDLEAMRDRLASGSLDTNVSVGAVTGMAGVIDAIGEVAERRTNGKVIVYPSLTELPLLTMHDLPAHLPAVAAELSHGVWTAAAERELLKASAQ
jgi:D-arabinose 1-dehydrogenase-like Zn-dependent alcohol dehydrogenase